MKTELAPWERPLWQRLVDAHGAGRLGHGLLFCGPPETGQSALAARLAAWLLCLQPGAEAACGECRSCRLLAAQTHADLKTVTLLERDDGRLKTEIGVEQIRELGHWFALTPQFAQGQVAVIDPADRLNLSSANAVLKTLEEPAPGRYLLLVSEQLQRLPATVRSRCQRVELRLPDTASAIAWLCAQGVDAAQAERLLEWAEGNPRRALRLHESDGARRAQSVVDDLRALQASRIAPTEVAQRWMADDAEQRLRHAVRIVRDLGRAPFQPPGSVGLTVPRDFNKLAEWAGEADRARQRMSAPLRHELLLTGLLQSWVRAARVPAG